MQQRHQLLPTINEKGEICENPIESITSVHETNYLELINFDLIIKWCGAKILCMTPRLGYSIGLNFSKPLKFSHTLAFYCLIHHPYTLWSHNISSLPQLVSLIRRTHLLYLHPISWRNNQFEFRSFILTHKISTTSTQRL